MKHLPKLLIALFLVSLASAGFILSSANIRVAAKPTRPTGIVRLHFAATGRFFCSGTVVSPTLILTAGHCAAATVMELPGAGIIAMPIIVQDPQGNVIDEAAQAVAGDPRTDQGLIQGNFSAVKASTVISEPTLNARIWSASPLISCGFPFGGKLYCAPLQNICQKDFQYSAESHLYPGMSGGPVFDANTLEIVGVNSAVDNGKCLFAHTVEFLRNMGVEK